MEILSGIFAFLMFIFAIASIVGLIKPTLVKQKVRLKAFLIYLVAAFVMMICGAFTLPTPSKTQTSLSGKQMADSSADTFINGEITVNGYKSPISLISISDFSYTMDGKQAVVIFVGKDKDHYLELTFLRDNIKENYSIYSERNEHNKEIRASLQWDESYGMSVKHDTKLSLTIKKIDRTSRKAILNITSRLVDFKQFKKFSETSADVIITGNLFDNLLIPVN